MARLPRIDGQGSFVQCKYCRQPCMWVRRDGRWHVWSVSGKLHRCKRKTKAIKARMRNAIQAANTLRPELQSMQEEALRLIARDP